MCKSYVLKDEAIRAGLQSFCSPTHMEIYQNEKSLTGKKAVASKKRYKAPPAPKTDPTAHAETLRKDKGRCRVCGSSVNLHVHHILYRSEISIKNGRDDLKNLITLCNAHHDMVHSDKKVWQPVLIEAARLREEENRLVPIMTLKKRLEK